MAEYKKKGGGGEEKKKERVLFATDKKLEHYGNLSGSAESKNLVHFSFSFPLCLLLFRYTTVDAALHSMS